MKTYIYNFGGHIYETNEPFDSTYRLMKQMAVESGEHISRQVIDGNKIINQHYDPVGIWLDD